MCVPFTIPNFSWRTQSAEVSHIIGSFVLGLCRWNHRRPKSAHVVLAASTKLLVDADIHSRGQIRQAINLLEAEGRKVETTIFGAPGKVENKKWKALMRDPCIKFEPVPRGSDGLSEPNDEAIQRALRAFSTRDVACVALLTSDKGFVDPIRELQTSGTSSMVLVPENKYGVVRAFDDANIKILKLGAAELTGPRVRAVLDHNGDGSVHLAEPYKAFDNTANAVRVMAFLKDLGFRGDDHYLPPAAAKFWFANRLGSLTVFPAQLATISVHEVMQVQSHAYDYYSEDLAFVLPVSSLGRNTNACRQEYGSTLARRIFKGGGPFILQDSPDLTAQTLRRLGYLDDDLNDDLGEALFCFVNAATNKQTLRRLGFLPSSGARSSEVCEKLRAAFLSHDSNGQWQFIRKDEASMSYVLRLLQKDKVLANVEYSRSEVFVAMKMYAELYKLPEMQTFNGLAVRIRQSMERGPYTRNRIEVNMH